MITSIKESGVEFGEFEEERLFRIEHSDIHKRAGEGIKAVEFIYLTQKENVLFVEAKTSCPNSANRDESAEKNRKYEEYYSDIVDKFVDSLNMFAATVMGRNEKDHSVGKYIRNKRTYTKTAVKFVLVITGAEEEWLHGPKAELEARLLRFRKIWNADVIVLNAQMAKAYRLIKSKPPLQATGDQTCSN